MMYPSLLVILVFVMAVSVTAADAAVTKRKAAGYLTDYYEMRIVELMAVRMVLKEPEPSGFTMQTNRGTTYVTIADVSASERKIDVSTLSGEGVFQASYYYDSEKKVVLRRTESR